MSVTSTPTRVTKCSGNEPTCRTATTWTLEATTANYLVDAAVLPKLGFTYRVRAHFDDPPATSGWAYLRVPIEAVNDLPAPQDDSYVISKNAQNMITVPAPGVLGVSCTSNTQCTPGTAGTGADRSSDNPTIYVARRAKLVSGPVTGPTKTPIGTLTLNPDGGFTFMFPSSFDGLVTFTYQANDGDWSEDLSVPMNGKEPDPDHPGKLRDRFSDQVAVVTIEVKKK